MEYSKVISEDTNKGTRLMLTLSEFRGTEYVHIRTYFSDLEDNYFPGKEGIHFPASISTTLNLLDAALDLCSKAESINSISEHLESKLNELRDSKKIS